MEKDKITAKKFTEYLDKVLAGEEVSASDELSDDLRSALDFARTMLANRDEPSPAFRSHLRERLLRKLAEQESVASSPATGRNPLEWVRRLFSQRFVLSVVTSAAVMVLLVIMGTWWLGKGFGPASAPLALPSLPAGEYAVNLPSRIAPAQMTFSLNTSLSSKSEQAAVYKIASPGVTVESVVALGRRLGFSGQAISSDGGGKISMTDKAGGTARQLTVWAASGAVEYGFVEPDRLYPASSSNLPSQNEAKKLAYDFLQKAGLFAADYGSLAKIQGEIAIIPGGSYSVSRSITDKAVPSSPTYWLVSFPYHVDGALAAGPGAKIEVNIGDGGEVLQMVWSRREMSPIFSGKLRSEESAYNDLISGKGSLDIPLASDKVVVKQVRLVYWIKTSSEQQDYALPVYEFRGECLDKTGRHLEDFTAWTEALLKTY
jgi:hypothetical protein